MDGKFRFWEFSLISIVVLVLAHSCTALEYLGDFWPPSDVSSSSTTTTYPSPLKVNEYDQWRKDCRSCYRDSEEPFPGITWGELKEEWGVWWEYPCLYYTEEALLSVTEANFLYTTLLCEGHQYWWSNGKWYWYEAQFDYSMYRQLFHFYRKELKGAQDQIKHFFSLRDNQGQFSHANSRKN